MLQGYFDESYTSDPTSGQAREVVVGGALALSDQWDLLTSEWSQVLARADIHTFHMSKFEANQGEFRKWKNDEGRHRRFLNDLLDIVRKHIFCIVGACKLIEDGEDVPTAYGKSVQQVVKQAYDWAQTSGLQQDLDLVFAENPEFSNRRIEDWCKKLRIVMPYISECTGGSPAERIPLQVADLLVYEIRRWNGMSNPSRWRYPLQKLRFGKVQWYVHPPPRFWQ